MEQDDSIVIKRMNTDELRRLSELDRSEHVTLAYKMVDGDLTQIKVDWRVPAWSADDDGDHGLSAQIDFCRSHLDQGGVMLGAFKEDVLVGTAVARPRLRGDLAQLAFLHVSRRFRRKGIAGRLMREACEIAREAEARRMYVSAVPSSSAVDFYRSQGCVLAEEVDPELYALEPEDIHLILDL